MILNTNTKTSPKTAKALGLATAFSAAVLAGCANNGSAPSSASSEVFYLDDEYYYVPAEHRVYCEERGVAVKTPSGEQYRNAAGVNALNAAKGSPISDASALEGKTVYGVSETRCRLGYGRYGYEPDYRGYRMQSAQPDNSVSSECRNVAGSIGGAVPGALSGVAGTRALKEGCNSF